jgi:DNA-binding beta-propeller fold protein YncE
MVVADDTSIYVYDPVLNTSIKSIIHGLTNPSSIAVDPKRKYIFVADNDLDGNTG